jgi:hypothetical protein
MYVMTEKLEETIAGTASFNLHYGKEKNIYRTKILEQYFIHRLTKAAPVLLVNTNITVCFFYKIIPSQQIEVLLLHKFNKIIKVVKYNFDDLRYIGCGNCKIRCAFEIW